MNNNICQFYVLFGNRNFVPPQNNDVYINATDIYEVKDLSTKILDTYKEKAKSGIKVGSEIIFLIPNEKYRPHTEDIIKKLKVNGKIEIMAPKVELSKAKLEPTPPIVSTNPVEPKVSEPIPETPVTTEAKPSNEVPKEEVIRETKQEEKAPVYHPTNNVYKGTIDNTTYNNFKKPKKSNKLPIIIFIISLIFFIISLLLLLFA